MATPEWKALHRTILFPSHNTLDQCMLDIFQQIGTVSFKSGVHEVSSQIQSNSLLGSKENIIFVPLVITRNITPCKCSDLPTILDKAEVLVVSAA